MPDADKTPTFNLKAVLQETGLKPDTLRAWERRYGLPQPQRSSGGHRLYSQRDIEIIKWLTDRQGEGLSISRAVELWRSLETQGRDPLRTIETGPAEAPGVAVAVLEGAGLTELREMWKSACLSYDERRAEQVLSQAFALHSIETVGLELLQKGLAELGEGWYRGEVTVQQEHFASELAMRRLKSLLTATPPPTRPDRILMACPPQEEHTFGPLLLTLFLRRRGLDVLYLGSNVPLARLGSAIEAAKPQAVILSAQQLHTAASLLRVAHFLQEQGIPLAYGGLVFNLLPGLRNRIPGYFLGERINEAPSVVEQVLSSPPPLPKIEAVSEEYKKALRHYRERQGLIDTQVWESMQSTGITYNHLNTANSHFGLNITSALSLGDMEYLGADIEWARGLLSNHGLPGELLCQYLESYYQAAKIHLDEWGAPVVDWLACMCKSCSGLSS
jgi:DNA-binding transcriptional MerR regulator/methylmalonyl-CoA mutase cobalamin-binding subunit